MLAVCVRVTIGPESAYFQTVCVSKNSSGQLGSVPGKIPVTAQSTEISRRGVLLRHENAGQRLLKVKTLAPVPRTQRRGPPHIFCPLPLKLGLSRGLRRGWRMSRWR